MVMALAGNKADLEEKGKVTADEARLYAEENGLFFMDTSAKTAANVNEIFYEIGLVSPPSTKTENQQDFYATFHKTPNRKKFSKQEWEDFTGESTRQGI